MTNNEIRKLLRTLPLVEPSDALDQRVEKALDRTAYQEFADDLVSWCFHRFQFVTIGVSMVVIVIVALVLFPGIEPKEPVTTYVQLDQVQQNLFCAKPHSRDFFGNEKRDVMKLKIKRGGSLQ